MITEFIKYEQALALKELGFDEPCMGYYVGKDKEVYISNEEIQAPFEPSLDSKVMFRAPLYNQCFRWFRKKHNLQHEIFYQDDLLKNGFKITDILSNTELNEFEFKNNYFELGGYTYEETEEVCINKLIEIVKNK
jgi:hypothetical protein